MSSRDKTPASLLDGVAGRRGQPTMEQRRAERSPLRATMRITPMPHGIAATTMSVTLRDYSARGVRFECPRSLEPCEYFLLHVPAKAGQPARSILCRVVHVTELDRRVFVVGAEFVCVAGDSRTDVNSKLGKARIGAIRDAILD